MGNRIKVKYGADTFYATKYFIEAAKVMVMAELKMLARQNKDPKSWYCGGVKFKNLAYMDHLEFRFGGKEDRKEIEEDCDVFVKLPVSRSYKIRQSKPANNIKRLRRFLRNNNSRTAKFN